MLFTVGTGLPARMVCYGASGTGAQLAHELRHLTQGRVDFLGYVDDVNDPRRRVEDGAAILSFEQLLDLEDVAVFVPIHDPVGRRAVFDRLAAHRIPILGSRGLPLLVPPQADVGEGSIVTATTRLGPTTRLGRGVLAMADLIAHDVEVGDFTTLAYGSVVLGHVVIGSGVFIGARAVIRNGSVDRPLVIGDGAVVGAGAVIMGDVRPGEVMVAPRAISLTRKRERHGRADR